VNAGNRSLDSNNLVNARHLFALAYQRGMSKDSMFYFAAEIYLRSFNFDTALIFNWAVEKKGNLQRNLYLEQRARIFRLIGWKHQSDSLLRLIRKKELHEWNINTSVQRSSINLGQFTLTPINLSLTPDEDLDDMGRLGFRYQYSRFLARSPNRLFMLLDANSDIRLPTRYSFVEKSDTLIRSFAFSIGAGELPRTPEFRLRHRIAVHADGKTDHYSKAFFTLPAGTRRILLAGNETKWTGWQGVRDNRTELICSQFSNWKKLSASAGLSLAYHFSKTDPYRDKSGSSGIYRPIPVGFIDSLDINDVSEPKIRYYMDRSVSKPYKSDFLDDYWIAQPRMMLLSIPEHDMSASLQSSLQYFLPGKMSLTFLPSLQGIWYTKKAQWFSVDDTAIISYAHLYDDYAVVYDAATGSYYIHTNRTNLNYNKGELYGLQRHERTRLDLNIGVTAVIEKTFSPVGAVYFTFSYIKGFSTIKANDPLVTLHHYWEIQAGWKKDFTYAK